MSFIALNTIKFDRIYNKGEIIPDNIVEPKMEKFLIDCGKISRMELVGFDDEDNSGKKKEAYIETIKPNKGGKKNIVKKE